MAFRRMLKFIKNLTSSKEQQESVNGAEQLSKPMWDFLTGVDKATAHIQ